MPLVLPVRMGEIAVSGPESGATLVALGLGSCIGLCLYDPLSGVAGMAHIVLPTSASARGDEPPGKYADHAVAALARKMHEAGVRKHCLQAAIAGGAHVFTFGGAPGAPRLDIGARNASAVIAHLRRLQIPLAAQDCGGASGRTVHLYQVTGIVTVRTVGSSEVQLACLGEVAGWANRAA